MFSSRSPLRYRAAAKIEGKAYLLIFACALIRVVHLELLHSQETGVYQLLQALHDTERTTTDYLFSYNYGLTYKAATTWLENVRR